MGQGQKFLTRVGSGQIFVPLVGSAMFGLGLTLENFTLKSQFFALRVKKILSGWVKKYPGQSQVGLLFTARQKYDRVRSNSRCVLI